MSLKRYGVSPSWLASFSCVDIDECEEGSNDCDREFATCENTNGSYNCSCNYGFTGDGVVCSRELAM